MLHLRPSLLRLALFLLLPALVLVLACRRDGPLASPSNFSAPLPDQLLGAPAEVAFFLDIDGIRRDRVYGPIVAHQRPGSLSSSRELRWLDRTVDRIDVWVLGVNGPSRDITALAALRSDRIRESDFGPGALALPIERRLELPSGVVMFTVVSHDVRSAAFLVDGCLVLATGTAIAPAQLHFTRSRALPPALGGGRDALSGAYGRKPALANIGPDYWGHAVAASVVWSARSPDLVASASFDDDASTTEALAWVTKVLDARAEYERHCGPLVSLRVDIDHADRTLTVRVSGIRDVLAAALQGRLCAD